MIIKVSMMRIKGKSLQSTQTLIHISLIFISLFFSISKISIELKIGHVRDIVIIKRILKLMKGEHTYCRVLKECLYYIIKKLRLKKIKQMEVYQGGSLCILQLKFCVVLVFKAQFRTSLEYSSKNLIYLSGRISEVNLLYHLLICYKNIKHKVSNIR